MNGNKLDTATEWIDPDGAPELTDAFFEKADEYMGEKLVRRGRPPDNGKKSLHDGSLRRFTLSHPSFDHVCQECQS